MVRWKELSARATNLLDLLEQGVLEPTGEPVSAGGRRFYDPSRVFIGGSALIGAGVQAMQAMQAMQASLTLREVVR